MLFLPKVMEKGRKVRKNLRKEIRMVKTPRKVLNPEMILVVAILKEENQTAKNLEEARNLEMILMTLNLIVMAHVAVV